MEAREDARRRAAVEVHWLSLAPDLPCYLVCVRDLKLVVDCPLDLSVLRHFLPAHPLALSGAASQPREKLDPRKPVPDCPEAVVCGGEAFLDGQPEVGFHAPAELKAVLWDSVDAVLISHSRTMLGLPFVTERTKFRGKVLATEPTVQFARQLMEGLTGYLAELPRQARCLAFRERLGQLPFPLGGLTDVAGWTPLYSPKEVARCLERVERVSFSQNVRLFGHQVEITPLRSGHAIGACNWLITTGRGERIACVGASTVGSSHALPMDRSAPRLQAADLLVMSSLSRVPHLSPRASVASLIEHTVETLLGGGNVLFPVHSSGLVFDLIEAVSDQLAETDTLVRVPIYFIASQAKASLAYANIFSEWLTEAKQRAVLEANPPFIHEHLIRDNRLRALPAIHGEFAKTFRSPCVVFAEHPSLRLGPIVHLLGSWRESAQHSLILTEPDGADMRLLLGPFQPLHRLRVFHCPVDNRLTFHEANALLYELAPRRVLAPREYVDGSGDGRAGPSGAAGEEAAEYAHALVPSRAGMEVRACARREVVTVPLGAPEAGDGAEAQPESEPVEVDPALAAAIQPVAMDTHGALALVNACLHSANGKRRLVPPGDAREEEGKRRRAEPAAAAPARCLVGRVDPERLVAELASRGLTDAKVDSTGEDAHLVYFRHSDVLVRLTPHNTHILTSDEKLRTRVRDALLACLTQL